MGVSVIEVKTSAEKDLQKRTEGQPRNSFTQDGPINHRRGWQSGDIVLGLLNLTSARATLTGQQQNGTLEA